MIDYLVVGGGGAGGTGGSNNENLWGAGGGGAGGVLTGSLSLGAQSYTVTVGAGGAAASHSVNSTANGGSGTKSVFGGFEAFGGGGGAGGNNSSSSGDGLAGGSGGGGGGDGLNLGGAGTTGQGFGGGTSRTSAGNRAAGGGGGGASALGQIGGPPNGHNSGVGGNGGAGLASSITGSSVTYGGGGGGGGRDTNGGATSAGGSGGAGGGGAGTGTGTGSATSGTDGLGGGGGGSGADGKGGDGGDGIVVVRYKGSSAGTGGTVSSGTGTAAGYTIHSFTTVGNASLNLGSLDLDARLGADVISSVTGTGALNVDTQGTVLFTGSATHAGGTNLVAGNLILGNGGSSGALGGDVSVSSGATLEYNRSGNANFSSLTGSGNLLKKGSGTLTLAGATAFTGAVEVQAGRLEVGNSNALSTGTLTLTGGTLSSDSSGARTISNAIVVSANSNFGHVVNTGALTLGGGVDLTGGTRTLTLASDVIISSSLSNGHLVKAGAGALTLSGDNSTFSGDISLGVSIFSTGGALRIGSSNALGTGALVIRNTGSSLLSDGSTARTIANAISFADTGYSLTLGDAARNGALTFTGGVDFANIGSELTVLSNVTISGVLSNASGGFTKSGGGTLTLSGANGSFAPTNWFTINAGKVRMGSADALGTARLSLQGGALTSVGATAREISQEVYFQGDTILGDATDNGVLTLAGNVSFASGTRFLTINSDVVILGSTRDGNLVKNGYATLTLSGNSSSHTGQITVDGGTLVANGSHGASYVYVGLGSTLAGSGTIAGNTVIDGVHRPGNSPGIQTFSSNLTYNTGSALIWELGANSAINSPAVVFDQVIVGQDLFFDMAVLINLSFNPSGYASTVNWSDAFWLSNRSWQIFDVGGTTNGLSNISLGTQDWLDAQGDSFNTVLGGSFSLSQSGADIFLNYSAAIPEPSTYGLILGGLALAGAALRRRKKKTS
jgi:autotransporter-associated beta strand protein